MGKQNYDGPGWDRPALLAEVECRGIWFRESVSDEILRSALMLYDEEHLSKPGDRGPWIQTFSGGKFYPLSPRAEEIDVRDIACSLALTVRFNGHLHHHYSVAQHSLILREFLPPELNAWALVHDAAEAYLGDLVRPVKLSWSFFSDTENNLLRVVANKFNLTWPMPEELKRVDFALGLAEAQYFGMDISDWSVPDGFNMELPPIEKFAGKDQLINWSWKAVESVFLRALSEI